MNTSKPSDPNEDQTASPAAPETVTGPVPNPPLTDQTARKPLPGPPEPGEPETLKAQPPAGDIPAEEASFAEMLMEYEQHHGHEAVTGEAMEGTVIEIAGSSAYIDLGIKREGVLAVAEILDEQGKPGLKAGDPITVAVTGRSPDGYYQLTTAKTARPKDWSALEKAHADGVPIAGSVTGVIRGGLSVDIGARAFLPASRSGARDAAEMEALVGQEIRCKIIQLDTAKEDVVVDRRAVLEEEVRAARRRRLSELEEGSVVTGTVRTLTDFGAFVDLGGVDGLLHVADLAWHRVRKPSDVLKEGEQLEVKILKVNPESGKVSLGRKQIVPDPWSHAGEKYKVGDRIRGTVVRLTDFGAFVELEPGVDGMIHISEMSWTTKIRKPADVLKRGEEVETVVLNTDPEKRRIALGLKQALENPWDDVETKFPVGSTVEGPIKNMAKFGVFVELTDGMEGMIHIADITREKRLNHPNEMLKQGQVVKAQVLEIDRGRKRIRLGMKQLEPTSADEYIAEHKVGDVVTGRVVDTSRKSVRVELGDGVFALCRPSAARTEAAENKESSGQSDLSTMTAMLAAKWKSGSLPSASRGGGGIRAGQVSSFRIVAMDPKQKRIEIEISE